MNALARQVIPQLYARKSDDGPSTLRIWSAGCGTGEEAYSIAMALCEALPNGNGEWQRKRLEQRQWEQGSERKKRREPQRRNRRERCSTLFRSRHEGLVHSHCRQRPAALRDRSRRARTLSAICADRACPPRPSAPASRKLEVLTAVRMALRKARKTERRMDRATHPAMDRGMARPMARICW